MKIWKSYLSIAQICALCLFAGGTAYAVPNDLADSDITLAVEIELIREDAAPSHKIDVSTKKGIVTLSGTVDSYYAKLAAEDTAESVKGVTSVVNNIRVWPEKRLDSTIRGDVVMALAVDPVTDSYEIGVDVEDGVVTLTGKVDSYTEKTVAVDIVKGIRGVVDIKNKLVYDILKDRSDADIKADIEYRLKSDASIDSGRFVVKVKNGKVTLSGSAGSAAEKSEVETETRMVPGVTSVVNKIDIKWWMDSSPSDWDKGWTDADMQKSIKSDLLANPRVNQFKVIVKVDDGVATLTGKVDNLQAKRAAEEEALEVLGVWRVKNYLHVRPPLNRADAIIAIDIRDALRRNTYVDRYDIAVRVFNGIVYLTGEVDSWFIKKQALKSASGVQGVIDVKNNLDVDYRYPLKTDKEIKDDIQSQLWWSPFVDSDDISVVVQSGVATLLGTVEDWGELQDAIKNAREGGATSVINKLKIKNGGGSD
ncbi:MAG: BON domain-containing protein [Pirellulales bacterium]|nr:BON domain-containing protein [Pirellulales bacterium]